ncbi:LuxR C-terminal-related transcriptional regulator [Streptomyces sp. NPDC046876]|uniref:helix-turn-helix transcriptional regulator n=1 Tax=Streptomyces sp. NPDC046876 TaxID=3155616 RepID=UPI0033F4E31B
MSANMRFLGTSPDDEETYRLLLRRGGFSQAELARHLAADAADGDSDTAQDPQATHRRLVELGLVRETPGGQLAPVSPAKAVEGLVEAKVARLRKELEEEASRTGIVDSLLAEHEKSLEGGGQTPDISGTTQHIEGMASVRAVIDELTFFTRTESLTTSPTGVLSPESISHARLLDSRILRRKVHMRTLMASPALEDAPTMAYLRELASKGAHIRISYEPLERLIICDRAAALTPIDPARSSKGAILTRDPGLVAALVSLFERMWQTAHDLPASADGENPDTGFANSFQRQILRSLYAAEKDEIGARELGIAVRTYRKHVASIMQRLGASNRFQAALLARERGWI